MKVTMSALSLLKEKHQEIGSRISRMSADRGSFPVFMIEHGLSTDDLSGIRDLLWRALERDPNLSSPQWNWSYLPLLAVTAEVGYRYQGTGTDFWPVVEQDLHLIAGGGFRLALVRLFELGHREFGIAKPGNSAWERHFPLIAWPIANALVPLELQPQLASALRQALRAGISGNDPEALYQYLVQIAVGQTSRRFENWLHQTDTASEVMRRLLYPASDGWLSGDILERIDGDLRKDVGASRAIHEARRITERKSKNVASVPPARYVLALKERSPTHLLVRGPVLPAEVRQEVVGLLRSPGDRIRAIGTDRAVPLRTFLFGGSIAIGLPTDLPAAPLCRDGELAELDEPGKNVLAALQPRSTCFFLVGAGHVEAQAVFPGEQLPVRSHVIRWIATGDTSSPEFRWLSTADKADAEVLRRSGFVLGAPRAKIQVIGLPLPGTDSKFAAGFPVFVSGDSADASPKLDGSIDSGSVMQVGDHRWSVFKPACGEHWIQEGETGDIKIAFEVVELPEAETAEIALDPPRPTLADLESGSLSVRVSAPVALENVPVRLRLTAGGMPAITSEGVLERVPALIRGNSKILQELRSRLFMSPITSGAAKLRVSVDGFRTKLVELLPPINRLSYDPDTGLWSAEDGLSKEIRSLIATPNAPIPDKGPSDAKGLRLLVADASDQEALSAALVLDSGQPTLVPQTCIVPPVIREALSASGRLGLVDLARSTIAWKLAQCRNAVSDWQRTLIVDELEAAVTRMLCGDTWLELEKDLDLTILSSHGALVHCAWRKWLTRGDDLPVIATRSDRARLNGYLIQRFRDEIPDVSLALSEWDDDTAGNLDLAVIDAYDDLRRYHEDLGHETFEEPDMSRPAHVWKAALQEAADLATLPMFKPLILPARRWNALVSAWYGELTQDELVDLLDSCHVDSFRRPGFRWMGRSEIRTLLQFWLSPAQVMAAENWAESLAHALSDIQTARAIRYVALRWRLAAKDLPEVAPA
ncbi:hypothetical protein [uncultured Sphingomonas sp.]|uniref:hypothetical protein n=1 Tax=uncultured Sphingomonas sp. TaxID=158754 RepID=UPI002606C479|nr:hypothetical protein [uncultured Sphingomonas sp.]